MLDQLDAAAGAADVERLRFGGAERAVVDTDVVEQPGHVARRVAFLTDVERRGVRLAGDAVVQRAATQVLAVDVDAAARSAVAGARD